MSLEGATSMTASTKRPFVSVTSRRHEQSAAPPAIQQDRPVAYIRQLRPSRRGLEKFAVLGYIVSNNTCSFPACRGSSEEVWRCSGFWASWRARQWR